MGANYFIGRIKMFTSTLCIVLAVCATLASHSSGFQFEGLYEPGNIQEDELHTSTVAPAYHIGPEFWNRMVNHGNREQLMRTAVKPAAQNVTRDADTRDKKKKRKKDKETTEIPTAMQPTPHPPPAEVRKLSQAREPRFESVSQMHPNSSASVVPHAEAGYLFHSLGLLTNDAHLFVQMLEELNEKNYKTLVKLLRHHHSSSLAAADYDAMLQTWMQIAIGSEALSENFLRRMYNLAGANRSADYTSALLSNLRIYLKSYVSGILKRQDTVLQTAFGFVNQTSITSDDFTLLEKLLGLHQEIHTHSFKTMNIYVDLVNRLVDIKPEST
ncbi:unnamed protein product [Dicrocoelium dendriticum]|nr:unnamed protein product [Dicrocoelium dendriticum]CAH8646962.1 unnamed protein product [Dicrocoelium dendriticum]